MMWMVENKVKKKEFQNMADFETVSTNIII